MPATATHDDDLLIISDDTGDSNSDEIDFSFDFGDETDTTEAVIEKEESSVQPEVKDEVIKTEPEVAKVEESIQTEEALDFGLDFSEDTSSETQVDSDINIQDESTEQAEETSFDLGLVEEKGYTADTTETVEVSEENSTFTGSGGASTGDDSSMNEILSATIAKLSSRKTSIASQKETKLKQEDEIQSQIQKLQSDHETIEQELAGLDNEADKITKNIQELENMKLDPIKEHNAKRVAKKR
ncbi:hypothetical protein N9J72_00800 [Candidatus Gracilibacteria bacterium]|nr:hypothetical protein [Candidatus Gracilibacteria bacterium]